MLELFSYDLELFLSVGREEEKKQMDQGFDRTYLEYPLRFVQYLSYPRMTYCWNLGQGLTKITFALVGSMGVGIL
jgi:hypothetical protein